MLLSAHAWTLCWWRTWRWFSLYMPGLSSSGGQGNATLCTCLDSLPVEEKELLLSGLTARHMPGISHTGGQLGSPSLCTYLDSLLVEGTELLLSVRTWIHCWWKRGNSFPLDTLDSLLVEDMEMVLSVRTWTLC